MIPIAIYHWNIGIVSRGKGKSAVAAAAYRSGEKLTNEWDGMTHDYTRKGGVVHTEIMLPPHAPPSFSDRSTLWNSVELYEKAGNAQLAREIDAALPIELSREEQIRLVREYCSSQFVSRGMCVDFVIHDTNSGKTRFFCKPSLLQAHSSYVCTDPKGTLLPEIGTFLERKKYRIKCLNLINFRKSMKYNPLAYIRSEKDILKLVNALIMNTKGEGEKSSEDFWVKAERLYYSALIGYIWYEATEEEKNFITLLDLINASEAREDDETYQSPVDLLFSQLEEREPDHFAVKQYRKFKMAVGDICSK